MTTRVEEVKARFAAALAKAERADAALALLPEDLRENALVVAQQDEVWCSLCLPGFGYDKARSIHDAAAVFERLRGLFGELITCQRWQDGWLRTKPGEKPSKAAQLVGTHQLRLDINSGYGYGPDIKLIGYFNTAIGRIRIDIPIKGLSHLLPRVKTDPGGRYWASIRRERHAGDATTKWATGSNTSYHYSDWFETWESFMGWLEMAAPLAREA